MVKLWVAQPRARPNPSNAFDIFFCKTMLLEENIMLRVFTRQFSNNWMVIFSLVGENEHRMSTLLYKMKITLMAIVRTIHHIHKMCNWVWSVWFLGQRNSFLHSRWHNKRYGCMNRNAKACIMQNFCLWCFCNCEKIIKFCPLMNCFRAIVRLN